MSGVEFNEDNEFHMKARQYLGNFEVSNMEKFLINNGIAKNKRQATYFLIGLVIFLIVLTAYAYFSLIHTPQVDYVVGPDGEKYSVEEYVKELGKGNNILEP